MSGRIGKFSLKETTVNEMTHCKITPGLIDLPETSSGNPTPDDSIKIFL